MSSFIERILLATRFTTVCPKTEFLPRKVGLGCELASAKTEKSVLRPVLRAIRRRDEQESELLGTEDNSSEEVSRMAHIAKRARK